MGWHCAVDIAVPPVAVCAFHELKATEPPLGVTDPVTNLKIESLIVAVVSLVQPVGAAVCWKPMRVPAANALLGVEAHDVPFDVSIFPVVLGATASNAPVPFPIKTLFKLREDDPVPPSATARSVIPVIVPPVIVAELVVIEVRVAVPAVIETACDF